MISYVNMGLTKKKNEWAVNTEDHICIFQKQGIRHFLQEM